MSLAATSSIDPADVARFSAQAKDWWDPRGPFAPLHRMNPARLNFIREEALIRFGRDGEARRPFVGLSMLDVGCGGGLLTEPMTRLGFDVTGIDASDETVAVAAAHASEVGLSIDYRAATAEALSAAGERFDLILASEVIEHVADPGAFLRDVAAMLKPGGLLIVTTLNRTLASLVLAKGAAEYVLRWAAPGTHDWRQFLKPEEIRSFVDDPALSVDGPFGIGFNPLSGEWRASAGSAINYAMTIARAAA